MAASIGVTGGTPVSSGEDGGGELAPNTPVFFEDASCGWGVGVVLGYTQRGLVAVRDPQRGRDVEAHPRRGVVPVPPAFTGLKPSDFCALRSLSDLPPLPPAAWEPACLFALLHRMSESRWETPVALSPPLLLCFTGASDREAADAAAAPSEPGGEASAGDAAEKKEEGAAAEGDQKGPDAGKKDAEGKKEDGKKEGGKKEEGKKEEAGPSAGAADAAPPPPPRPLSALAASLASAEVDRCCVLLPAAHTRSIPLSGRAPFSMVREVVAATARVSPPATQGEDMVRRGVAAEATALCTVLEAFGTCSAPGRPCVATMSYIYTLNYSQRGAVSGVSALPVLIDHSHFAAGTMPFPPQQPAVDHARGPLLCVLQLTESALVGELGLPPQQSLVQMMPPCHFDATAPTFNDVCGALELLGVGGRLGVQVWAVLGGLLHLLIARWILLRREVGLGEAEAPYGVMTVQQHITWAARCMQMPREDLCQMLQVRGPSGTHQMQFSVSPGSLTAFTSNAYERLVRSVLAVAAERQDDPARDQRGESRATHIVSALSFEPVSRHTNRGMPCRRLDDRVYIADAVASFYERHAPAKVPQTEAILSEYASDGAALGTDSVASLLANLEVKYDRPGWFATRERLVELYARLRPELLASVDDVLMQYQGREVELFEAIEAKYREEARDAPPLFEQLQAFFRRHDPGRADEAGELARQWAGMPLELERQLSDEYSTQWLAHRRACWAIYARHNPRQLERGGLDALLFSQQYRGKEEELVRLLQLKYGVDDHAGTAADDHADHAPAAGGTGAPAARDGGNKDADFVDTEAWGDPFRLLRNSVFEIFHLLYMHHNCPQVDTIRRRQHLVDLLLSTAHPSVVASALDSVSAAPRQPSGEELVSEVVQRFGGGGASAALYGSGSWLTVEHSECASSYDLTALPLVNCDPLTRGSAFLLGSGNETVRALAAAGDEGDTWIGRSVRALTRVVATLGTAAGQPVWLLHADTHSQPGVREVDVPSLLRQLRRFYIDVVASEARLQADAPPPQAPPQRPSGPDPARLPPLVGADPFTSIEAHDPLAAIGGAEHPAAEDPLPPLATVAALTRLQQHEWTARHRTTTREAWLRHLSVLLSAEGGRRQRCAEDEEARRSAMLQSLKLRTVYILLAESCLRIERREDQFRDRIRRQRDTGAELIRVGGDGEALVRSDIIGQERRERRRLRGIAAPVLAALHRADTEEAAMTFLHGVSGAGGRPSPVLMRSPSPELRVTVRPLVPKVGQPALVSYSDAAAAAEQGALSRFLELLEADNSRRQTARPASDAAARRQPALAAAAEQYRRTPAGSPAPSPRSARAARGAAPSPRQSAADAAARRRLREAEEHAAAVLARRQGVDRALQRAQEHLSVRGRHPDTDLGLLSSRRGSGASSPGGSLQSGSQRRQRPAPDTAAHRLLASGLSSTDPDERLAAAIEASQLESAAAAMAAEDAARALEEQGPAAWPAPPAGPAQRAAESPSAVLQTLSPKQLRSLADMIDTARGTPVRKRQALETDSPRRTAAVPQATQTTAPPAPATPPSGRRLGAALSPRHARRQPQEAPEPRQSGRRFLHKGQGSLSSAAGRSPRYAKAETRRYVSPIRPDGKPASAERRRSQPAARRKEPPGGPVRTASVSRFVPSPRRDPFRPAGSPRRNPDAPSAPPSARQPCARRPPEPAPTPQPPAPSPRLDSSAAEEDEDAPPPPPHSTVPPPPHSAATSRGTLVEPRAGEAAPPPAQQLAPARLGGAGDARLQSFDHVRGLVMRLVELQRLLVDPENSAPEQQRAISDEMWHLRAELSRRAGAAQEQQQQRGGDVAALPRRG